MREGWEIRRLGDIASYASGSRPSGGVGGIKEGVLSLGGEHIGKNGWLDLTSPKYVEHDYYTANPKGHITDNDILLCKDGALTGKVAIVRNELVGKKAMVNEHVFVIRSSIVRQPCLYYFLFSPTGQTALKARITGAAQGGINGANLKTILVPVPPIAEQEKIVAELDCLTGIIEKKKQQLEELDKLAQSIFYDMFGDIAHNSKLFPVEKICDLGELARGVSKHRPRNAPELLGGEMPLIQTGDVANADLFIREYHSTYSALGVSQSRVWEKGTICITIAANIGNCAILSFRACFPDSVVGFIHNDKLSLFYALFVFNNLQALLEEKARGIAQKNINLQILNELLIPVPPRYLQDLFAQKIEAIEKQKELVKRSIVETETLFNSRMDYWFN